MDDLNSINNSNFATLKGSSDDIREGKLSFPMLLFFRECADQAKKAKLESILNDRRGALEDLLEVQGLLAEGESPRDCQKMSFPKPSERSPDT